jgi:hypothetical protein
MLDPGFPGPAKRYSWLGQLYRHTADLVDVHEEFAAMTDNGCTDIALYLDRPGSRSHARWRLCWTQDGRRDEAWASGARIVLERGRRRSGGVS